MQKLYIETYGCQMNVADSETVASILAEENYVVCQEMKEADLILVNTCSVRENAENKIYRRLEIFRQARRAKPELKIGVIGCMAERVQKDLIDNHGVNLVAGPDSYRKLPALVNELDFNENSIDTKLSIEETYSGICPTRLESNGISGFVSITRGCNNFCTYCIVPYTRGRERSRDPEDILLECGDLAKRGYKELTLLGQNVNSYIWEDKDSGQKTTFSSLMGLVAETVPEMRIRFTTSHPKDMSDDTLRIMASHENICKNIHLPVQSGSNKVLKSMNRKYTREDYMNRIEAIRTILPDCTIGTDIFCGFPAETPEDHAETLSLMKGVGFNSAFMFKYSERPGTYAAKNLPDDIPEEVKGKRLQEIIDLQIKLSLKSNHDDIGQVYEVLAEGLSKKSDQELFGRTSQNKVAVFPKLNYQAGDLVKVKIRDCTSATLKGDVV
ncbi:MAG: tRNA (N6-isopentenyl adenosine(37)-C2)-methylthiotransferase MiaB [Bacteroidetes bacterium]|nr:tRNA (N6-isopentenyl adenosine(37)-C2)-methylthiotransferase MiaB [Bacteroidota bacterium]